MIGHPPSHRLSHLVVLGGLVVVQVLAGASTLGIAARLPGLAPAMRVVTGGFGLAFVLTAVVLCIDVVRIERAAADEFQPEGSEP